MRRIKVTSERDILSLDSFFTEKCNLLHCRKERFSCRNNLHMNLCLASPFTFTFCCAQPAQICLLCSAKKHFFAFVVIICGSPWLIYLLPQVFDVLKHIFVKYIGNISGLALDISLLNVSAIYRDWLHSLGTRSADDFLKVSSTSSGPTYTRVQWPKSPRTA